MKKFQSSFCVMYLKFSFTNEKSVPFSLFSEINQSVYNVTGRDLSLAHEELILFRRRPLYVLSCHVESTARLPMSVNRLSHKILVMLRSVLWRSGRTKEVVVRKSMWKDYIQRSVLKREKKPFEELLVLVFNELMSKCIMWNFTLRNP